jgi:glycosyltransferase involved in cell wall biosynthesis
VVVFLPAHHEEATVAAVVGRVPALVLGRRVECLVVDDGSGDRTAELAAGAGATVLATGGNRGLGAAVRAGLVAAVRRGAAAVAVVLADGTVGGIASWRAQDRGGPPGGCYEIGLALLPEHRGRGLGTAAQRLLVDQLFGFTTANRLEATTDADNVAEQKALTRVGFAREGVLRGAVFRAGAWRDLVLYALLREQWGSG